MCHRRHNGWPEFPVSDIVPFDRGEEALLFDFARTVSASAETPVLIGIEQLLDERFADLVDGSRPGDATR